jgi:signal transduction histidine kinase
LPAAPKPANEVERLKALRAYAILDTPADKHFTDLVEVASYICQTPIAMVSLVDADRQWFKAKVGIDEQQTSRDVAFCAHAILQEEMLEVRDATLDPRFADSALVTGEPGIRFYAGVPLITSDNFALGTLCVVDRQPRQLNDAQREALEALSRQVVAMIETHRAYIRVRELAKQKDEFLRVASHDLKNPLQAIRGATDLLGLFTEQEHSSPEMREFVAMIHDRADAMQRIIEDFVDCQAMEDGQLRLTVTSVDLTGVAREVVAAHALSAQAKEISLTLAVVGSVPAARVDRARLSQVLENLVGNAIKFSPRGAQVVVRLSAVAERIRIEVTDTGPGLAEADMPQLFTRYGRLSAQPTGGEISTGLGLAICRQLVEAHVGQIGAGNNEGPGATFWLEVPV